jgi:hypothetical protein
MLQVVLNANKLAKLMKKLEGYENWLQYFEIKHEKNPRRRPIKKVSGH